MGTAPITFVLVCGPLFDQTTPHAVRLRDWEGVAATPAYRERFSESELMVPRNVEEFHAMLTLVLGDESVNERFRRRGYEAVAARHTSAGRASEALTYLGILNASG